MSERLRLTGHYLFKFCYKAFRRCVSQAGLGIPGKIHPMGSPNFPIARARSWQYRAQHCKQNYVHKKAELAQAGTMGSLLFGGVEGFCALCKESTRDTKMGKTTSIKQKAGKGSGLNIVDQKSLRFSNWKYHIDKNPKKKNCIQYL